MRVLTLCFTVKEKIIRSLPSEGQATTYKIRGLKKWYNFCQPLPPKDGPKLFKIRGFLETSSIFELNFRDGVARPKGEGVKMPKNPHIRSPYGKYFIGGDKCSILLPVTLFRRLEPVLWEIIIRTIGEVALSLRKRRDTTLGVVSLL